MTSGASGSGDRRIGGGPGAAAGGRRAVRRRRLPIWKLLLFAGATALFFFAALEGLLALLRVRPVVETEDPYVGFVSNLPLYVEESQPDGTRLMVTARNKLAYFNPQQFPRAKPNGTFRIFCLGGSTTFGHPYDDRSSYPGWLREILNTADPSRKWEVINAGGVSYASYREAALVQELARYAPDLFVVYSGHNEFLERRTYEGLLETHPSVTWLGSLAGRTRTYAVVRSAIATARHDKAREAQKRYQMTAEVDALLDASVGPAAYTRDDTLRQQVEAHYSFNLSRMARIARQAGARIVYVTPASNLKDCSPFKSEHGPGLSAAETARCDTLVARGKRARAAGDLEAAQAALAEAVRLDPRDPGAQYQLGKVLFARGRYSEAQGAFETARDEDVCPLRNQEALHQVILEVARTENAPCVDFVRIVADTTERAYGHRIPGEEFFLDHAHPIVEGNRILAAAIAAELETEGVFRPSPGWEATAVEAARRAIEARMDPTMQAAALRNVAWLFNWAGKSDEAARLAARALDLDGESIESLVVLASQAAAAGRSDEAIRYYTQALAIDSLQFEARNNLAVELAKTGRYEEALSHYEKLLSLRPDQPTLRGNLGFALLQLGRPESAVPEYERVVALRPMDARARVDLGYALLHAGRVDEALASYRKAVEIDPKDAGVRHGLAIALAEKGERDAALAELDEALRLQPRFALARTMRGILLAQSGDLEAALAELDRAVADDPQEDETHLYRGRVLAQMGRNAEALAAFDAALRAEPASVEARGNRARLLIAAGRTEEGVQLYREALRMAPDDPQTLTNFAWTLATHPDRGVRDGKEALRLAKHANELTGQRNLLVLDALAAAQAEAGEYAEAVATAERAAALARSSGQTGFEQQIRDRIDLYAARKPYRE